MKSTSLNRLAHLLLKAQVISISEVADGIKNIMESDAKKGEQLKSIAKTQVVALDMVTDITAIMAAAEASDEEFTRDNFTNMSVVQIAKVLKVKLLTMENETDFNEYVDRKKAERAKSEPTMKMGAFKLTKEQGEKLEKILKNMMEK